MTAPASKIPWYKSQWFWVVTLLLIGLRLGYKAWKREQRPSYETTLEQLNTRNQRLQEQIRASQAASTAPVVVADSALLADSTSAAR